MKVGGCLTRIHLWVGEHLGLTRYSSCWACEHARKIEPPLFAPQIGELADRLNMDVCYCTVEPDCIAPVNPSDAVWCASYIESELGLAQQAKQDLYEKGVLHD